MARERISLVSEEVRSEAKIRAMIESGEMNPEVYTTLSEQEKIHVSNILFKIASEKAEPNVGVSVLEFVLMAFIRITTKKLAGLSLNAEDQEIEASLNRIMGLHEITDGKTPKSAWLFDYMQYAEYNAAKLLQNRYDHIQRKMNTIGEV